jgi:hypothetical protein
MNVDCAATFYCVLDAEGSVVERGSIATTATDLGELARRLSAGEEPERRGEGARLRSPSVRRGFQLASRPIAASTQL